MINRTSMQLQSLSLSSEHKWSNSVAYTKMRYFLMFSSAFVSSYCILVFLPYFQTSHAHENASYEKKEKFAKLWTVPIAVKRCAASRCVIPECSWFGKLVHEIITNLFNAYAIGWKISDIPSRYNVIFTICVRCRSIYEYAHCSLHYYQVRLAYNLPMTNRNGSWKYLITLLPNFQPSFDIIHGEKHISQCFLDKIREILFE